MAHGVWHVPQKDYLFEKLPDFQGVRLHLDREVESCLPEGRNQIAQLQIFLKTTQIFPQRVQNPSYCQFRRSLRIPPHGQKRCRNLTIHSKLQLHPAHLQLTKRSLHRWKEIRHHQNPRITQSYLDKGTRYVLEEEKRSFLEFQPFRRRTRGSAWSAEQTQQDLSS